MGEGLKRAKAAAQAARCHVVERTGYGDTRRIMLHGELVGMALELMNGWWGAFDVNENRLTAKQFKTPAGVRAWFDARPAPAEGDAP